ncbi:MAG: hypothetical protein K6E51_07730 [Treponema sp.]|nr:hypothetical protein [Treponema sp.]
MMQKTIWTDWNKKRALIYIVLEALFCFFCGSLIAEETSDSSWTLAAVRFTYDKQYSSLPSVTTIAQDIPQLVLEHIAKDTKHIVDSRELLQREFEDLHQERLSLLVQLTSASKTRDALVLQYDNPKSLSKAIIAQEKKIKEITDLLDKNTIATQELQTKIQTNDITSVTREEQKIQTESVALYKNSPTTLYTVPSELADDDYDSYAFVQQVLQEHINGLLTGTIHVLGDYVAVTVDLRLYPDGKTVATVTDVGKLSDVIQIAKNLARLLTPKITNSKPVRLHFFLEPEVTALITIDGSVVKDIHSDYVTSAGIHTMSVEAEGYERILLDYAFVDMPSFSIHIRMKEITCGSVNISLLPNVFGTLYTNVVDAVEITPDHDSASILVNGKPLLGGLVNENKEALFFYIPDDLAVDGNDLEIREEPFDVSADIEKHRRRMYTAYSALVLSLPLTFYTYGKYVNYGRASALYSIQFDETGMWQRRCWASIGLSVGLGAVFVYQLIRYLKAADNVLPVDVEQPRKKKK